MNRLLALPVAVLLVAAPSVARAQANPSADPWTRAAEIVAAIQPPAFPARDFPITRHGAVEGGAQDATAAIRSAIEAAHKAGGGRVVVPAGVFLTGAIHLKSNVNLHVSAGATLKFVTDPKAYLPVVFTRWEGVELMNYSPLVYAFEATNIALTGTGTLDGQADALHWWPWKASSGPLSQKPARDRLIQMAEDGVPVEKRVFGEGSFLRPNFIQFYRSRNILIEGVTIRNSPMWVIHPVLSRNITVRGVTVKSLGPNSDGFNPESSSDVLVENAHFDTGDDCIAIKSGRNADGRRLKTPSERIVIRNSRMVAGHGGVVIGSEISGGARDVFAEKLKMSSPDLERGLRFKTNFMRGGVIENVYLRDVEIGEVGSAIDIDLRYEEGRRGNFPPTIRNVRVERMTVEKAEFAFHILGFPDAPIRDVVVKDSVFRRSSKGQRIDGVANLLLENVTIDEQTKDATPPRPSSIRSEGAYAAVSPVWAPAAKPSAAPALDLPKDAPLAKSPSPTSAPSQNAVWRKRVAAAGSADFRTLQDAIATAPTGAADFPSIVEIAPGAYRERLYVQREKRYLRLVGLGPDPAATVVTFDLHANVPGPDGRPIGTFRTPTVQIDGDDFSAENLTFANAAGPVGQALALRLDGDRSVFRRVRLLGFQDTLLVNRGRHYFEDAYIEGSVDFIFGAGAAWFERPRIHAVRDGWITAASTPPDAPYGFVFRDARVTGEPGVKTLLGRPWRDHASVAFVDSDLSDAVRPEGWSDWNDLGRSKTARYSESGNRGPGANAAARVAWARRLNPEETAALSPERVLGGAENWTGFQVASASRVDTPWSIRMAESVMAQHPDVLTLDAPNGPRWEYTQGLVMKSLFAVADAAKDPATRKKYFDYAASYYDRIINADGTIRTYRLDEYNIDRINPGKPLFGLYAATKNEKYEKALQTLRHQMREHPRTKAGGFWHKKRYPSQMWLDGLYMGSPFLAQWGLERNEPALIDDAIHQFVTMEKVARDENTGLLFHGWDESRAQTWADPKTGRSPAFWGRAMGWYAMALVDVLDYIPRDHKRRGEIVAILRRLADAAFKVQDGSTGVWYQVVDQPERAGNYREASVSAMFAYAFLKGSRLGYLTPAHAQAARRAYEGTVREFAVIDEKGVAHLTKVCEVAGLGPDPSKNRDRTGTFEYYISEPLRTDDPKGVGPFILASLEYERIR